MIILQYALCVKMMTGMQELQHYRADQPPCFLIHVHSNLDVDIQLPCFLF